MPDPLDRVRRAALVARKATATADVAIDNRDAAIVAAYRDGLTVREIADAAGMSYQRAAQIVRR